LESLEEAEAMEKELSRAISEVRRAFRGIRGNR
jgi:DNA-binding winged helix-turn-helix (wHTH) protein